MPIVTKLRCKLREQSRENYSTTLAELNECRLPAITIKRELVTASRGHGQPFMPGRRAHFIRALGGGGVPACGYGDTPAVVYREVLSIKLYQAGGSSSRFDSRESLLTRVATSRFPPCGMASIALTVRIDMTCRDKIAGGS